MGIRWLVVIFALGTALPAGAQPEGDLDAARSAFEDGLSRLDQGRSAEAAAAFERSLAAFETAPALFNLGLARRGMGQFLEAIDAFSRVSTFPEVSESMRVDSESLIEETRESLARVRIEIRGTIDELQVDGETRPVTPILEIVLNPGTHRFSASRTGHRPVEVERTLAAGAQETVVLEAPAEADTVRIEIVADVVDATLSVDGVVLGQGRAIAELPPGEYQLRVAAVDYLAEERELIVEAGQPRSVSISLEESGGTPISKKWWFWTIIGVAVAGSATAVALSVGGGPGLDTGNTGLSVSALEFR